MVGRYLQRLPNGKPVSREAFLLKAAAGKSVVHVGFTDHPLLEERLRGGTWLHSELAKVASRLVGLDVDAEGVEWAKAQGLEAHMADAADPGEIAALGLEPFDLVIAGEVIEHVDAPGHFLRAMHQLGDELIVTTPNAYRPLNVLAAMVGREVIHEDHVAWHSPSTLRRLHENTGWIVDSILYYRLVPDNHRDKMLSFLPRLRPGWSDGLIAVSRSA